MKQNVAQLSVAIKQQAQKLTARERLIVGGAITLLVLFVLVKTIEATRDSFAAQSQRLQQVEGELERLTRYANRYLRLRSQKEAIEAGYREVQIEEGVLSHLEALIKEKAGVTTGFSINDLAVRPFGGGFEQAPFNVKFSTSELSKLVDFLSELVNGPKRLILSKLTIRKSRRGDRLDVELDVSSIRRTEERENSG